MTMANADLQRWVSAKRLLFLTSPCLPLLLPFAGWLALRFDQGLWLWLPAVILYVGVPVLDTLIGEDPTNPLNADAAKMAADPWYREILFAAVLSHWGALFAMVAILATQPWSPLALLGAIVSTGATNGLALLVGHELGHKTRDPVQRTMAKIALAVTGYGHFSAEHNHGHHIQVATPEDSASARYGESIYAFARREIPGALMRGWAIERQRLATQGYRTLSRHNEIAQSWLITGVAYTLAALIWGWAALAFLIVAAASGWWQLTSANYVEHYGLLRHKLANGDYERCQPQHSWNSNRLVSNLLLLHLQRHSDHHAYAARPYQLLRDYRDVPQLPHGYGLMFLVAVVPPLWFAIMNPRVLAWADGDLRRVNQGFPSSDPC